MARDRKDDDNILSNTVEADYERTGNKYSYAHKR